MRNKVHAVYSIPGVTENQAKGRQISGHSLVNNGSSISTPESRSGRTPTAHNIARTALMLLSFGAIWAAMATPAMAQSFPGIGIVMTYNVNEGTDFEQVVGTTSVTDFLLGVGQVITQVQGTNPPERMRAVSRQI